MTNLRSHSETGLAVVIVLLATVLYFWGLRWHLPLTLEPDEHNIVLRALRFGTGDLNPHFFVYGSLTMYLCFALYGLYFLWGFVLGWFPDTTAFAVSYFVDPTPFFLIARSLSAASGVVAVACTFVLGKKLVGPVVGLAGALSLTLFAELAVQAHFAKPTVPAAAILALAYVVAVTPAKVGRGVVIRLFLVGLLCGLACSAHLLAVFGAMLAGLLAMWRNWSGFRATINQAALLGIGGLLGFAIGEPYFFLDFATAKAEVLGWTPGFHSIPFGEAIAIVLDGVRSNIGWVGCVWALLGIWELVRTRRPLGLILTLFLGGYFVFLTRGFTPHRYVLMVAPILCVLIGVGLDVVWRRLHGFGTKARVFGAAVLVALTFSGPLTNSIEAVRLFGSSDTRAFAREWILANIAPDSRVLLVGAESNLPRLVPSRQCADERRLALAEISSSGEGRYPQIEEYYTLMAMAADVAREPTYWTLRIREAWWAEREDTSGLVSRFGFVPPNIPPESELLPRPLEEYRENLGIEYVVTVDYFLNKYDNSRFPSIQRFFFDVRREGRLVYSVSPKDDATGPTVFVWRLEHGDDTSGESGGSLSPSLGGAVRIGTVRVASSSISSFETACH